ncbi:MAG: CHAD domain-containing protein, partial [Alphaproteobacteria bacterium]|nr:CHAD domain-containing protein [Alphaproteobacteria bacterium]
NPEPMETELRLVGDAQALEAVFASPHMALEPGVKEKVSDLESRYFDTADLELRDRGLAFRVRADGRGYQQTLKTGDDANAALLKRGEWQTALDDDRPRPDALPKGARQCLPKATFENGLQLAFTTRVRRRVREVTLADAGRIEAALDLGEIDVEARGLPIAELELELLEGRPEALYRLALDLQEIGPLRVETRSKSARAFDRLANRPPRWQKATTSRLECDDSVDQAMAAIFENCFEQWLANQAAAIDGRDPEGVHQMRVALRRLRSALSVFRKLIPPDQLGWLQADARQAIGALGAARDWDVFQADLLAPIIDARPDDEDLIALRTRARARCRAGYQRARKHLASADYTRFVLRFGAWLEERAWRRGDDVDGASSLAQPIVDFAGHLLDKRQGRVLAKGRRFSQLSTEQRHELRIALKKLRYSTEFFQPLFDKKAVRSFLGGVKALQEDLGHLNDVAVAETLMAELLARPGKRDIRAATGLVIGWHARGVADIEPKLRRDWKTFAAKSPFWR